MSKARAAGHCKDCDEAVYPGKPHDHPIPSKGRIPPVSETESNEKAQKCGPSEANCYLPKDRECMWGGIARDCTFRHKKSLDTEGLKVQAETTELIRSFADGVRKQDVLRQVQEHLSQATLLLESINRVLKEKP